MRRASLGGMFLSVDLRESLCSVDYQTDGSELSHIQEMKVRAHRIVNRSVEVFENEKTTGKDDDPEVSYESFDLHEKTGHIEPGEDKETEDGIDDRQGEGRSGVGSRVSQGDSDGQCGGFSIDLSSEESSDIADDSSEEEGEDCRIEVFLTLELISFYLEEKDEHESDDSSDEG